MKISLVLGLTAIVLVASGCSSDGSGMSADQEKMAQNVDSWAKSSDGDWNKLTADQQQQLIKSAGNEATAKMVLQMKAHPPEKVAPGRPGGAPPGPPPSSK